jgi:tRNA (cmo5U34)-methyltransferase
MRSEIRTKSTIAQIRERFDKDVERFSKLETGQQATIDAPLVLEIVSHAAASHILPNGRLLDIGCGAGNFTLSVLHRVTPLDCTLVDLSSPMLERACLRVREATSGLIESVQSDMRDLEFEDETFDVILAGAVLHHLRDDSDWQTMFQRLYRWLRPNGLLFIADLVVFDDPDIHSLMWQRYGRLPRIAWRSRLSEKGPRLYRRGRFSALTAISIRLSSLIRIPKLRCTPPQFCIRYILRP